MLNVFPGFVSQSRGTVLHGEGDIIAKPAQDRGFGVLFRGYALFPHLSALDNAAYPLWAAACQAVNAGRKPDRC